MINKFNALDNKVKLIAAGLLTLLAIALLVFQSLSISSLNDQIEKEKQGLQKEIARLERLKDIRSNFSQNEQKLKHLEKAIPSTVSEESILLSLTSSYMQSLGDFSKVSFSKPVLKSGYSEIPIKVSFNGTYSAFLDLLSQVKESQRAISINTFSIVKNMGMAGVKVDLDAKAYMAGGTNSAASAKTASK